LVVEGGAIAAVERDADAEPGDERLAGLVLPGLANAHSHVFHRALRGRTHDDGGTFWTWRERMYAVAARLDPDRYLALARAAYAEMALAGTTSVGELHYLHHRPDGAPYDDPHAMAVALVQAAADAGVRLTLLDTCYLAGGLDATGSMPLAPEQRRFSDGDAERWAARHEGVRTLAGERVVVGAAIHSVRAVRRPARRRRVAPRRGRAGPAAPPRPPGRRPAGARRGRPRPPAGPPAPPPRRAPAARAPRRPPLPPPSARRPRFGCEASR